MSATDRGKARSKSQPTRTAEEKPSDEGWESMVEEESEGSLAENPELEAALQEAAAAIDESGRVSEAAGAAEEGDAEVENFRRRAMKERTEAHQYGHQNLVKDLLSTVDNLDRAINHARGASDSGSGGLESLLQGVELVQRELVGVMERYGVTETEALGKPFDPALHEAMAQSPDDSVPANTIVEVLEKGYQLRGRLIRPSRVIVAQPPEGKDQVDENEQNAQDGEAKTTD
jgi:molecular chaperone GrpE